MPADKYTAVWVSHSSISDFLACPRAYFLKHIYRDPQTGHKIKITTPSLTLGQAVHEVLDEISTLPTEGRFKLPLPERLDRIWKKVEGKRGGFRDTDVENTYKERARTMLARVALHPGPLKNLAVKIKTDLPYFWLSEEDGLILCGKIDWLEYLPDTDSVHIIDFKTGKRDEDPASLQLPIYHLLVGGCQTRPATRSSYWYLDRNDEPTEQKLPDLKTAHAEVLKIARDMKLARQLERFKCPHGESGCFACRPLEAIRRGEGELVGQDEQERDMYLLDQSLTDAMPESEII